MPREMHFITRPAISHQRRSQPAMLGQYVGSKIAPDMVTTEMVFLFNQHDFQFRPHSRDGKRDQATGKTAADNRKVTFEIFSVHATALAQAFCKGKPCPNEIHSFLGG